MNESISTAARTGQIDASVRAIKLQAQSKSKCSRITNSLSTFTHGRRVYWLHNVPVCLYVCMELEHMYKPSRVSIYISPYVFSICVYIYHIHYIHYTQACAVITLYSLRSTLLHTVKRHGVHRGGPFYDETNILAVLTN